MSLRTTTVISALILLAILRHSSRQQQRRARRHIRSCVPSRSNRATSAPAATRKSSGCAPRISRRGRSRCAASSSAARPKAGRCSRSSLPPTACSTRPRPSRATADRAHAGRHPRRRDRRQGRRLLRAARDARRHRCARRARCGDVRVRAGVQRRRPRALRPLEPAQPGRPGGDGLAHDRAEPQPQPRLHEGRRAGDAGDAAAAGRVGPDAVRRPARHRRRAVRARRLIHRRADAGRRRRPAAQRPSRCATSSCSACAQPARCRSTSIRRSCATTIPTSGFAVQVGPTRFSTGILGRAQPHRRAGRDAFVEGLPDARAHHAQLDHRDDGDGRARRPQVAGKPRRLRTSMLRASAARASR